MSKYGVEMPTTRCKMADRSSGAEEELTQTPGEDKPDITYGAEFFAQKHRALVIVDEAHLESPTHLLLRFQGLHGEIRPAAIQTAANSGTHGVGPEIRAPPCGLRGQQ